MELSEKQNAAKALFEAGYNCAQSVAGAFYRELGMSRAEALALSSGFGAGFSRLRETCGAVSAMTMVLGSVVERGEPLPSGKQRVYEQVQAAIRQFEADNGSSCCRVLLGLPEGQRDEPVPEARTAGYYAARPCLGLILYAVAELERRLAGLSAKPENGVVPLDENWYAAHAPQRPADGHKGIFGRVVALCGSENYRGAAVLCCEGALRSGAGLVQLAAPAEVCAAAAARRPEITFLPLDAEASSAARLRAALNGAGALVMGCGLGRGRGTGLLVQSLLADLPCPAVADADALNLLAGRTGLFAACPSPLVLTPHLGEMSRLSGLSIGEIAADLPACAKKAAGQWNCTVVLKSSRTAVAAPDGRVLLLDAPNSGLAKGGSGDVLAGLIAGLLAQGLPPFEAAGCGVWLHSAAARRAADARSEASMLATDLLAWL